MVDKTSREKFIEQTNNSLNKSHYGRVYLYDINGVLMYTSIINKIKLSHEDNNLFLISNMYTKMDITVGILNVKSLKSLGYKEVKENNFNVYEIYLQQI